MIHNEELISITYTAL